MTATSTRPYLIRAIYEWAVENSLTPFLMVDTSVDGVTVPEQFIKDNSIVLNVSPGAVRDLNLGDEYISFSARFAGVSQDLFVPIASVRAVYAKENGEGIVLPPEESGQAAVSQEKAQTPSPTLSTVKVPPSDESGETDQKPSQPKSGKPHLTIVE